MHAACSMQHAACIITTGSVSDLHRLKELGLRDSFYTCSCHSLKLAIAPVSPLSTIFSHFGDGIQLVLFREDDSLVR